jgi:hypothetical protein
MLNSLGFMVNDLSFSQASFYLINYANKAVMNDGHEVIVFYENPVLPCLGASFSLMQMHEAWDYSGPLIANNINLASKLINLPGTSEKYFYVWDLEWTRVRNKHYHTLARVYRHPNLKLIARSLCHSRIISSCWNVDVVGIVENYNIDKIIEIVNAERYKQRISTK